MNSNTPDNTQMLAADSVRNAEQFWRGLSDFYVKTTHMTDLRTRATARKFVYEAKISASDEVLDAGCGHLRISMALMRLLPGVKITGVDLTQELLDEGARLLSEEHLSKMELVRGDLASLPFYDDSFDKIISARVFQYISDPVAVCRELLRALRPGGRIILSVPNKLNPIKQARYRGRLYSPTELGAWLTTAGYSDVTIGSACFVPGELRRGWDSAWIAAEGLSRIPVFGLLGGNAWASGTKPFQGRD